MIPCYNAGDRLRPVVEGVIPRVGELIVVDDGSTDGSAENLSGLAARVERLPENRGKGAALLTGFRLAMERPGVRCVGVLDADGQHDPADLGQLYEAFSRGDADLVIGSRVFEGIEVPWRSRFGNHATAWLVRSLFRANLPDTQSGYRLHSIGFLEDILATIPPGRYETEMAIVLKALREARPIVSVPIRTIYEAGNPSSHFDPIRDSWRVWRAVLKARVLG